MMQMDSHEVLCAAAYAAHLPAPPPARCANGLKGAHSQVVREVLEKAEKENPALAEKIKAAQENGGACLRLCMPDFQPLAW